MAVLIVCCQRTSDGGYGNHSVSLPIILIKIKVDQMLPSSYISSLLVYFYDFAFDFLFPYMYSFILGLKWSLFVLNILEIEKYY